MIQTNLLEIALMKWIQYFFLTVFCLDAAQAGAGEANPYIGLLQHSRNLRRAWKPMLLTPFGLGKDDSESALVPALVLSHDPASTIEAARSMGAKTASTIGKIISLRALPEILMAISKRPEVVRVEAGPPKSPLLDLSRPAVKADKVEQGEGLLMPIDGTGVITALVDTGVDYKHTDFQSSTGRTRVLAIWDQAFGSCSSCEPPPGQDLGVLCDRDSLLKKSCNSPDFIGHGTHVSSTMAGSGQVYRGMAPGAQIMAVASIDFALLVDSVKWLFDQAAAEQKPMVINLSLGGHYGPHDGTSLESQALSELTGPGRIIMASAGNEGSDYIHLGYDPAGSTGKTIFRVFSGMDSSSALFTIWLPSDSNVSFSIGVQKEGQEMAETDMLDAKSQYTSFDLSDAETALGKVQFSPADGPNPENGKLQLDILVEPSDVAFDGNPDHYLWYIKASGTGKFDAWSAASGFLTPAARFSPSDDNGLIPGDNAKSVGMPAVAPGIIAVASWATRDRWQDIDGKSISHIETTVGDISFFSSRGPSADPEYTGQKPFIAAPGEFIVAALSNSSGPLEEGTKIDEDSTGHNGHVAMRGTSMSCPHAAGIVALLLQINPKLDPRGIEKILAATADKDEITGDKLPDQTWGYGKINAWGAVAMAMGVGICQDDTQCTEGWECGDEGRCEQITESGCSCSTNKGSLGQLSLLLLLAGLVFATRRLSLS